MEVINKDVILDEIPLFSNLSVQEKRLIKERNEFREYKKGQIIYQEGAPADAFYCLVLGRAVIYTKDNYGNETILEYLHRGKYFGIISLLTGDSHSVTAKAINDCLILTIKKEDFDFILNKIPRLAIDLSQVLSRRLKRKDIHQKIIFESTIISVFSSYSQAGKTLYALNLALGLKHQANKSVLMLDIVSQGNTHSLPRKLDIGEYRILDLSAPSADSPIKIIKDFILQTKFDVDLIPLVYQAEDVLFVKRLVNILSILVNDYHYIILELPSSLEPPLVEILNQSDFIHILTSPEPIDLERAHHLIERLKTDFHFQESKIEIIINEYKFSKLTHEQQLKILGHRIFATLPRIELGASERLVLDEPDCEYARAIRRISRQLSDCLVGLALGIGVAYGFCHIGVLKVIEEEKIPIDVISGSSIGALIASLWATGKSSQEILEITKDFKDPRYIWGVVDLGFPWLGFIKGRKLYSFLKRYLGNKTFYDTKLPLKIVTSDVKRKESHILEKGLLIDAVMASCAMPGIFRPFKSREGMLLDGGVVHPLPVEALFNAGARKIIAVNVTPSREDIIKQHQKIKEKMFFSEEVTKKRRWFGARTNILDIIFSSIEVMQSQIAEKEAQSADIVLHPNTFGLYWLELHKAQEFAKRGEEEARRNLDRIWRMINE